MRCRSFDEQINKGDKVARESLLNAQNFYGNYAGDLLVEESLYPPKVVEFLQREKDCLRSLTDTFQSLIEVGSMDGLHLEWAAKRRKRYVGIDIVERYIEAGNALVAARNLPASMFSFYLGDATRLDKHILEFEIIGNALLFFPFNSFGNMGDERAVASAVLNTRMPCFISTYRTDRMATQIRLDYYDSVGYSVNEVKETEKGVAVCLDGQYYTIAYSIPYVRYMFGNLGIVEFSDLGMGFLCNF